MQGGERLRLGAVAMQSAAQPERQGHLQDVAAGMGGEPSLQVRVDAVGEPDPGATMHVPARLGRDDVADHFGLGAVPAQQQVERCLVLEPGETHREAAPALHRRRAQQMEGRDQCAVGLDRPAQDSAEPIAPAGRECVDERRSLGGERRHASLGRHGRLVGSPPQPLKHQFNGVVLQDRPASTAAVRTPGLDRPHPFEPRRQADQRDQLVQGSKVDGIRGFDFGHEHIPRSCGPNRRY